MGDRTGIEWTDASWNVLRGCTRVSPGCGGPGQHGGCYAEGIAARFSGPGQPFEGLAEKRSGKPRWTGKVAFAEHLLTLPLRWRRPRRIFVNSMSDLFHEDVPDAWIDRVFAVMALAPQHTFQILTKRSARMRAYTTDPSTPGRIVRACVDLWIAKVVDAPALDRVSSWPVESIGDPDEPDDLTLRAWPLPNVWKGVSAEDQRRADEGVPDLLATPAAVRFVSAEPLLGPIDLSQFMWPVCGWWRGPYRTYAEAKAAGAECGLKRQALVWAESTFLDWVIVGGESGPNARPMQLSWARDIVEQCRAADVACFVKQMGTFPETDIDEQRAWVMRARKGDDPSEWPADLRVRDLPHA